MSGTAPVCSLKPTSMIHPCFNAGVRRAPLSPPVYFQRVTRVGLFFALRLRSEARSKIDFDIPRDFGRLSRDTETDKPASPTLS
jgi:hypothetical protein